MRGEEERRREGWRRSDTRVWRCISCPDSWKRTSSFGFQLWDSNEAILKIVKGFGVTLNSSLPSDDEFTEIRSFYLEWNLLAHLQLPEDAALAARFQVLQSLRPEVLLLVWFCAIVSHSEPGVERSKVSQPAVRRSSALTLLRSCTYS